MTKEEYKILFKEYYNALSNFALTILRDKSMAEDAVQEVFVKMWQKHQEIKDEEGIKSYLFTATRNKCIEMLRKQKLDAELRLENERRIELSASMNMDEEAEKYLMKEKLYCSIRQLPPKCQQVFTMSKLNGLTYTEIANQLSISQKTVESQMGKAMKLLREYMKK